MKIQDLPLYIFRPEVKADSYPTLLYYHGWSSKVERYAFMGRILAAMGLQVIMPEVALHGVRQEGETYEDHSKFAPVILSTMEEFDRMGDQLEKEAGIDPTRYYIGGHSMGAIIAASLFSRKDIFSRAVLFNGIVDFEQAKLSLGMDKERDSEEDFGACLEEVSPMRFLDRLGERKLLALTGMEDKTISPRLMQEFREKLKGLGPVQENFDFIFYPNASHDVTYKMIRDASVFLGLMEGEDLL